MKFAFHPHTDDVCIIEHADGLDVTVEEIESAYIVTKTAVEDKASVAPAGIINPKDIHALTLREIANTFPSVRHDDVLELGSVVDVPVSADLTPVFKETFCAALSTLGKWNIQDRTDNRVQKHANTNSEHS